MGKFYVTTPIYYASGEPHIGHAYTTVLCDFFARFKRMTGHDVFFLTGMDEHGSKIYRVAKEKKMEPQKFVDDIAEVYKNLFKALNITNDDFVRTTEERHKVAVAAFWKRCAERGDIYKKKYTGLYCVGCEAFKKAKDLHQGLCPDHNQKPEELSEENYFFKLNRYQRALEKLFSSTFVVPKDRAREMEAILKEGLEDVSISRHRDALPWGIPVPEDESQIIYVWFDALINYLTAVGFGGEKKSDSEKFKYFWPADVHIVGKEINRFHSLLWPAMLMSAGIDLPKTILVHGWITVNGQKMSKTVGNVIDPFDLVKKYGVEAVRYYMGRELPAQRDGDFSYARFEERYNADLAHGLGNLFFRILTMAEKYKEAVEKYGVFSDGKGLELSHIENYWKRYLEHFENYECSAALDAVWEFISFLDKMINNEKPWELAKSSDIKDAERLAGLLNFFLESCYRISWMIYPFLPETSDKMLVQLGFDAAEERKRNFESIYPKSGRQFLGTIAKISKGEPIFPLYVSDSAQIQINK